MSTKRILDQEIEAALTEGSGRVATKRPLERTPRHIARPDRSVIVRPTSVRWHGGMKVRVVGFGADVRQGVRVALPVGSFAVMHPDAGERLADGTVRVHEDSLRDTAG